MPKKPTRKAIKAINYNRTLYLEKWQNGNWYVTRNKEGKRLQWLKHTGKDSIDKNKLNKLIYKPTQQHWEKILRKRRKEPTSKLKEIISNIKQKPKIKTLENEIDNHKIINFGTEGIKVNGIIDLNKATRIYKQMLMPKLADQTKVEQVIQNRQKLLKHRLTCTIKLYTDRELKATINIAGLLLENETDAYNYWTDMYLDSQKFNEAAEDFKNMIGNPKQYIATENTPTPGTIKHITVNWQFV